MKNLVKQWQKLLQSPTPNGLGNLPRPSHSPSPHPSLPAPLVDTPRPEQPPQHPKPTINRLKMQHMLSKVKAIPQQAQIPTQPVTTAQQTQLVAVAQAQQQQTQIPVTTAQQTQLVVVAQVQQQQTQIPTQPVTTAQQTQLVAAAQAQQQQTQIPVTTVQQTQLLATAQAQQQQTQIPTQPVTTAQQTQLLATAQAQQQQTQIPTQPVTIAQQTQLVAAAQAQQQQTQIPVTAQQTQLLAIAQAQQQQTQIPVTTAQQTQLLAIAQAQQQQTQVPTQPVTTAQQTQLAAHPLPNCHSYKATSEHNTPSSMSINNNSSGKGALSPVTLRYPHRTDNLVVKIPRHLVKITSVRAGGHIPSRAGDLDSEVPLSLIVSIDKSLLWQQPPIIRPSNSSNVIPETENSIGHSPLDSPQSTMIAELDSLAENTLLELKRMPLESVPGVHGCLGPDGLWYDWTEPIPGSATSVTVLPYVYIDGWESMDVL